MLMKLKMLSLVAVGAIVSAGVAQAATMSCTTSGSGNSTATLSLTDAVDAQCFNGNDSNDIDSSTVINGSSGWILADKNDDTTSGDQTITFTTAPTNVTKSGSWGISGLASALKVMVNLKAGNGWGSFEVESTLGTWTSTKDLSHASIYYIAGTPPNVVPLPAAGWMLIAGLGAMGAMRRRKKS